MIQDAPGEYIDLSHLSDKLQQAFNDLFSKYTEAFSKDKFDIGLFSGFGQGITLDVHEGMVAFQKERPIKGVDAAAIDDTIQGLIRAGVFTKATEGHTQFCANLNCVSKPSPSDTDFGKCKHI